MRKSEGREVCQMLEEIRAERHSLKIDKKIEYALRFYRRLL